MAADVTPESSSSVADEVSRLLRALQGWAGDRLRTAGPEKDFEGPQECRVCPVCRALGTLREARPDIFDSLSAAASAVSVAVADLVHPHEVAHSVDPHEVADVLRKHDVAPRERFSAVAPHIERIDIS